MATRVLIVDDEKAFGETLSLDLARRGYTPTWAGSAQEAIDELQAGGFDVMLADVQMRGSMNGLDLCAKAAASYPDMPVIVITGFGSMETAIQAMRAGAYDFLSKPFDNEALALAIDRAAQHRTLKAEVRRLRDALSGPARIEEIIGESTPMKKLFELVDRVADTEASVLITGESGTGKELFARAIHRRSRRQGGPFVPINCAAIPPALLESELFGHAKGAFTDARMDSPGMFMQANGGTLFLDEIADLPLELQPKLLRALQERCIRPVGKDHDVPVDVRVIAATNRDIESAVEDKRFREDLFFRINVIRLELPPLRARGSDMLLLAQRFVQRFAQKSGKRVQGISAPAADRLVNYPWPGNVRELANAIERAVALTSYEQITPEDLPQRVREHRKSHILVGGDDPSELVSMDEVERRYVLRVLEAVGGNKTLAARILGFDRKTLYRKLDRYEQSGMVSHG